MDDDPKPRFTHTRETTVRARDLRSKASRTERRLWPCLRSSKMGAPFRRQYSLGSWFADYACLPLNLVIEVDGPLHDRIRDAARDADLASRGFDVLRFSVQQLDEQFESVVATIYSEVQIRLLALEAAELEKSRRG